MAAKNPNISLPLASDRDLWVLPPALHSQWFSRVDWYLNWQLCKGLAHQPQKLSVEILRVMEENGIKAGPEPENFGQPLMVSSQGRLPVTKCVVIEFSGGLKSWLKNVYEVSESLSVKRMRVFLPKGAEVAKASTLWKELDATEMDVEFSSDEDATT